MIDVKAPQILDLRAVLRDFVEHHGDEKIRGRVFDREANPVFPSRLQLIVRGTNDLVGVC